MMILVIFGHSMALWLRSGWFNQPPAIPSEVLTFCIGWLNFTHIYVFVFCSGYLFYYLKCEIKKYNNTKKDIFNRAKRLLLPYIIACCFWAVPFFYVFNRPSLGEVVKRFFFATNPEQLWFLIMLFWVYIFFYLFSDLIDRLNSGYCMIIFSVLYVLAFYGTRFIPNVFQIWTACRYLLFFYLGYLFRKSEHNFLEKIPWYIYLVLSVGLYTAYYQIELNDSLTGLTRILSLFCCVSNVLLVITAIMSIGNADRLKENHLYLFLKKHSFTMYLTHQQIIYIVIYFLNSKTNNLILVLCSFIAGFVGSAALSVLISKTPILNRSLGYKT